jgi:hypothetical protein
LIVERRSCLGKKVFVTALARTDGDCPPTGVVSATRRDAPLRKPSTKVSLAF